MITDLNGDKQDLWRSNMPFTIESFLNYFINTPMLHHSWQATLVKRARPQNPTDVHIISFLLAKAVGIPDAVLLWIDRCQLCKIH